MPWSSLNIADIWKIFIFNLKLYVFDSKRQPFSSPNVSYFHQFVSIVHCLSVPCKHFTFWSSQLKAWIQFNQWSLWGPLQHSSFLLDTAKTWLSETILPLFINIILFLKSYLKLKVQMIYFGLDVCGVLYKSFLIYRDLGENAAMDNSCFWWSVI